MSAIMRSRGVRRLWQVRHSGQNARSVDQRPDLLAALMAISLQLEASRHDQNVADIAKERRETLTARGFVVTALVSVLGLLVTAEQVRLTRQSLNNSEKGAAAQALNTEKSLGIAKQAADAVTLQAGMLRDSNDTARQTLVEGSRAWIGPDGGSSPEPSLGSDLTMSVSFRNTGKTPAFNVFYVAKPLTFTKQQASGNGAQILEIESRCNTETGLANLGVAYPGTGANAYSMRTRFDKSMIDQKVLDGDRDLVVVGCFFYKTFEVVHHTNFCFYFRSKLVPAGNWSFCEVGNDAD